MMMDRLLTQRLELTVELGDESIPGQRWASVKAGEVTLFTEYVFDSEDMPAEKNIMRLFGNRLREVLERD